MAVNITQKRRQPDIMCLQLEGQNTYHNKYSLCQKKQKQKYESHQGSKSNY